MPLTKKEANKLILLLARLDMMKLELEKRPYDTGALHNYGDAVEELNEWIVENTT